MNCNCIGFFDFYTMSLEQNNLNLVITARLGCSNKRTFYNTYDGRFYVPRVIDLMKTAKVNAYIMYIFGKIELSSIHTT